MDSGHTRALIQRNAWEISRLNSRIDETRKVRSQSASAQREYEQACAEFRERYHQLAFPGGYEGALGRIVAGDQEAMEAAICFLEVRPYFFRSGYMFKDILRKVRRAPLSDAQAARLATIEQKLQEWRANKASHEA